MLIHSCLFLSCVLGVFNSPVATPAHGSSGLARVFDYDLYRRMRASLLALYIFATTHGPTSLSC